jgi:hypothetical protein
MRIQFPDVGQDAVVDPVPPATAASGHIDISVRVKQSALIRRQPSPEQRLTSTFRTALVQEDPV